MAVILRVRTTIAYGAGGPGLLTHYFLPATLGGSNPDATDSCTRVRAFLAQYASLVPNAVTFTVSPLVDAIQDTTGALTGSFTATPPAAVVGTGGVNFLPSPVAIVVRYNTSAIINGRRLSGRSFISPLSVVAQGAAGSPTNAVLTQTTTAIAALTTGAGTVIPQVWHRPKLAAPGSSAVLVSGSAWSLFGSLRSRRD